MCSCADLPQLLAISLAEMSNREVGASAGFLFSDSQHLQLAFCEVFFSLFCVEF